MPKSKDNSNDSRFFTTQKKGELHELRLELHATEKHVKVDAVKKVIASMTVGKDVSMLFTDVLNCVQTGNIELKKLVYLYLINYAKVSSPCFLNCMVPYHTNSILLFSSSSYIYTDTQYPPLFSNMAIYFFNLSTQQSYQKMTEYFFCLDATWIDPLSGEHFCEGQ